ncbi:YeeE/YedE family protein [Variovorax terrae]|uniref:YeeE/YedE family protein n=1 Tax=Variovorax terrae TaxID=2923278 RepID=A0A9X1VWR6_9BURK|nr:YeeE/YedE family protein [Variovorax terrae]MCJ0763322.1 YeeE/YedE family protein [Variovorax terrae]
MQSSDLSSLTTQVLWAAFFLSVVFGAIAQRTHFCTMGAVSDVVNMGDWTRMRQWGMAIGVAMIGFAALAFAGLIDPAKTLYASNRWIWLSAAVGGLMFGFGMVLASGCGSKTLVRIGGGSLKSLVVFVVMGVAAFATLKGVTAVIRVATVDRVAIDFVAGANLPAWTSAAFGIRTSIAGLLWALVLGGGLMAWAFVGFRRSGELPNNLLAGLGIGAVVAAMWWVSGHLGYVAEHPETLQEAFLATNSGRAEALSFVSPVAYTLDWLMFFSDKSKVLTLGIVSVFGVIAGSALCAIATRTFRWEGFGSTEDVANHLAGAVLMGVGGVTAMGCTIGQGLSGISTLSATSFVAVAAILAGAVAAFKYQVWRLDRMA